MSAGLQSGFAAALLDPVATLPAGLRAWNGSDPALRFAVYRNNVVTSLVAALAETVDGRFQFGLPHLSENAVALFRDEYRLPLLPPELGAQLAAFGEHALPLPLLLLLLGLATRLSAAGLLAMTAVIQLLVYPGAWPTHGTWAALLLMLIALGPGIISLDHLLVRTKLPE